MSVSETAREQAAAQLLGAYASGKPIAPLTEQFEGLDVEDAYDIQLRQVSAWTAGGARIAGHKVGLTARPMQRQLGVDEPDFGHLLDSHFHSEHTPIEIGKYIQPKAEPEIAFVLGTSLSGPGVSAAQAAAAVEYVLPALEIIDSRVADWRIKLPDTVADNASCGGVVLGSRPTRLADVDLSLTGCLFLKNGRIEDTGAGGAVLGSPLNALVWLANTLGALGTELEAGEVILPGSLTAALPVRPGDTVTAHFDRLGSVTADFAPAPRNEDLSR
ncbi:2-keto-4-pentenoate hydratase [Streptomyces sp. NBC_00208]|uniref:2-keto-4-pentenoate hydratase n=1 Tax=Streptomyces sp. NBC_00208 TaxID=2975681 RepID=UPI002E28661F|nr:2-keto-4-pentenoate hydratase [Streptomyces sp. NBC_00208]